MHVQSLSPKVSPGFPWWDRRVLPLLAPTVLPCTSQADCRDGARVVVVRALALWAEPRAESELRPAPRRLALALALLAAGGATALTCPAVPKSVACYRCDFLGARCARGQRM